MILQMSRESEMILIDLFECKSYSDVKETLLLKIYISIQKDIYNENYYDILNGMIDYNADTRWGI